MQSPAFRTSGPCATAQGGSRTGAFPAYARNAGRSGTRTWTSTENHPMTKSNGGKGSGGGKGSSGGSGSKGGNPNYPSTTGKPSGGGRGNTPK